MKWPSIQIPRCFDSHVHWKSTGEIRSWVNLRGVKSLEDLQERFDTQLGRSGSPDHSNQASHLKVHRGEWVIGFGWDETLWKVQSKSGFRNKDQTQNTESIKLHFETLDHLGISNPMVLYRVDGHALWCNGEALRRWQTKPLFKDPIPQGRVVRDHQGQPTGVFIDGAKSLITSLLPPRTPLEETQALLMGIEVFRKAGFSHIRDVGGSITDWNQARMLENQGRLPLFVEMFFNVSRVEDIESTLDQYDFAQSTSSPHLRPAGIKVFFDGALGSEGALLSEPYPSGQRGILSWSLDDLEILLSAAWSRDCPVAIHTLGDEAVHRVVELAVKLKKRGCAGRLHLEHCEIVRDETIELMKGLDLICHLQPSHFLSDREWLYEKVGKLYSKSFPWARLAQAGIPFYFGSDSPIMEPSIKSTYESLTLAAKDGIPLPPSPFYHYHIHPDVNWGSMCRTWLSVMEPGSEVNIEIEFKRENAYQSDIVCSTDGAENLQK